METFRFLLFGFAGISVVFWVAIIALWHAYMFPRFFNEDKGLNSVINEEISYPKKPILGSLVKSNNFKNRDKYSNRNSREKFFENLFFEAWRVRKCFQMIVFIAANVSVKFSSKSELSSRFFGCLKFPARFEFLSLFA